MAGEIILTDYDGIGMERAGAAEYEDFGMDVDSGEGTADNILHEVSQSIVHDCPSTTVSGDIFFVQV